MKPALVVMAAGMGSRFGGLKQMEPVTENGEVLLDFSVYDAMEAGFGKVVLVIKKAIEDEFERLVGQRLRRNADMEYVYQELGDLPGGRMAPYGRDRPWGTGQAVLAARNAVDTPFCVINADDFYGRGAFDVMAGFLTQKCEPDRYAMVGYKLGNTLTDYGSVARGVCDVKRGFLRGLTERVKIIKKDGAAAFTEDGETWEHLALNTVVSMQCFGFHPSVFSRLDTGFKAFLSKPHDPMKGEYLLPGRIGELVASNEVTMKVLHSAGRWFGVTYKEDLPAVKKAIQDLRDKGVYPCRL
jgi:NDP-sugar pyrophosphorylase family protein